MGYLGRFQFSNSYLNRVSAMDCPKHLGLCYITPLLEQLHPDGNYCLGRDCGIYWRLPEHPESLEKGAVAPDWFYVPHVPTTIDGQVRRSFVMWKETIEPVIALEFVSGNGEEERDKTPVKGKFWLYERAIQREHLTFVISRNA
jgi:Uma2 family endonuclease